MLNDKHSELTKYAGNLAQLAIHLEELQEQIQNTVDHSDEILSRSQEPAEPVRRTEPVLPEKLQMPEAEFFTEEQAAEKSNHNQKILDMYRNGTDAVEIAKELGLGVGEVKLVIGLFREEEL